MTTLTKLQTLRILPLVSFTALNQVEPVCQTLLSSGINSVEIAYRSDLATEAISLAARQTDLLVGAGTVVTQKQAAEAIEAGARFIVSPGLNPDVVRFCQKKDILVIPGVGTATEITSALLLGLNVLKFFPAESFGGVNTLKAFAGPFPDVRFMPAGGVNQENFIKYLALPQVFCCSGSWMVTADHIKNRDFGQIRESCRQALQMMTEKSL